uniref:Methyltransferase small domain-containing protein n=1 Tax=Lotharella oceanica TaxID=641309 RepID=A0A7S2XAB9_9EUKA|mmetsp:Transcript_22790/g.42824  ORF Transcript_22790/g.42824 Transcript_22790/m.42824 type:complete len:333 (+) Transcript_22790:35-1033(+)
MAEKGAPARTKRRGVFRCRHFDVAHDLCAHKVGTDSVLLGAWMVAVLKLAGVTPPRILDVGTGCGILALIAAQSFPNSIIEAVEVDDRSFHQAIENFKASKFSDRLRGYRARVQDFKSDEKYDVIVSNPPFFLDGNTKALNGSRREVARHAGAGLPMKDLFQSVARLLNGLELSETPRAEKGGGRFFMVFPSDSEEKVMKLAREAGLTVTNALRTYHLEKACRTLVALAHVTCCGGTFRQMRPLSSQQTVKEQTVKGQHPPPTKKQKSCLAVGEDAKEQPDGESPATNDGDYNPGLVIAPQKLSIRDRDGKFTDEYVNLTKEIYLKDLKGKK